MSAAEIQNCSLAMFLVDRLVRGTDDENQGAALRLCGPTTPSVATGLACCNLSTTDQHHPLFLDLSSGRGRTTPYTIKETGASLREHMRSTCSFDTGCSRCPSRPGGQSTAINAAHCEPHGSKLSSTVARAGRRRTKRRELRSPWDFNPISS